MTLYKSTQNCLRHRSGLFDLSPRRLELRTTSYNGAPTLVPPRAQACGTLYDLGHVHLEHCATSYKGT
eukprot:14380230-Alexandrium_andersonii.AAC.1